MICPECGADLECMCVIEGDESLSGATERLWHCESCLSAWHTIEGDNEIHRKVWG